MTKHTNPRGLLLASIIGSAGVVTVLLLLPVDVISGDLARLLLVCAAVIATLFATHRRQALIGQDSGPFRMSLVLWWFLLCSEAFFPRANNGADNAAAGRFSLTAYNEAVFWIFLAVSFLVIAFPVLPRIAALAKTRFSLAFGVVALSAISVLWAPEKTFSAAWSFKLLLGVLLIAFYTASLRTLRDVRSVLLVTFAAFAFLTFAPVVEGTIDASAAFSGTHYLGEAVVEQGRFHSSAHPLVIAGRAGILALLALLFYSLEKKRIMIAVVIGSIVVIALAGAKTAFIAIALSLGLFFSLRRRMVAGFGLMLGLALLAFVIVSTTAVGGYISDYLQSGDLLTISGRTDLWSAAWPEIADHLAIGHGYVASKLVSLEVGIPWYAGHLHNAILETLYNNGLPGLLLLLAINIAILLNLISLFRRPRRRELRVLSMCLLAMYSFIFLNGLTEPYFGGEASAFYLVFLSLFGITEWLHRYEKSLATEAITIKAPVRMTRQAYRAS